MTLPLRSEIGKTLVALLDGSREVEAIADELLARASELELEGIGPERLREAISAGIDELARAGALKPAD